MFKNILIKINGAVDGIRGLISFMTRIPMGNFKSGFEEISKYFVFVIFIGMFIGFIGSIVAYPFFYLGIKSYMLIGALVLFVMLYIQGFHHVDGLGDYGDAWMVMGIARKKLEVMRDKNMGVGAFMFIFFTELISVASIGYLYEITYSNFLLFAKFIILVESCSRLGLLTCACCGIPSKDGTGRYFVKNTDEYHLFIGYLILMILSFVMNIPKIGVICSTFTVFFGVFMAWNSNKSLKCVTGDVLGASTELTRALVYIVLIFSLYIY
ncbi:adenosylcobinamide-GDP ribazoletransferase [Methanothermococcus okinawensis]|uniref:Adenosylcobinamide-GDP ribazoletransferase n=1 Tax=Methanothermococcus okinawensis (strain DSM 14208 / JCM 11175 / IH1) TaxID=647113 RepID=F8AM45_METOI|nr:adenosylcobinamide-GDP ribazoletransferase [Methanothermococcus okinawensis]AEH06730.1 Cobalamin synthase [Methanothermococcus okinawensis IH1]